MTTDPFASHTISTVLAWIICVPIIVQVLLTLWGVFFAKQEFPRGLTIWFGLCFLIFSPLRYMIFQLATAATYPVQSLSALLSCVVLVIYVPIVFGILYAVGLGLPMLGMSMVYGKGAEPPKWRVVLACLVLPVLLTLGSVFFQKVLPCAGWTVRWLRAEDVIRSTNGPAYVVFKYFASIGAPYQLPRYFENTPKTTRDLLRCHVAGIYLNDREHARFIDRQYPQLVEEYTEDVP